MRIKKFLAWSWDCLISLFDLRKSSSVEPSDLIARFIYSKRDMSNGRVKFTNFKPKNLETDISVFVVTGLTEPTIWGLAKPRGERNALGYGELIAADVQAIKPLVVLRDDKPKYHALISGFPVNVPVNVPANVPEWRLLALQLEKKATLKSR